MEEAPGFEVTGMVGEDQQRRGKPVTVLRAGHTCRLFLDHESLCCRETIHCILVLPLLLPCQSQTRDEGT